MNLSELSLSSWTGIVYRLQVLPSPIEALKDMEIDSRGMLEMIQLLRARGDLEDIQSTLDHPFQARIHGPKRQTRFSDGSIRVFYSAVELETARKEVLYHSLVYAISHSSPDRQVYYNEISCHFEGNTIIDLRPHLDSMPYLVKDMADGYEECNRIGQEAVAIDLDGLATPSARNQPNGSCAPIFKRSAITDPADEGVCVFSYDASSRTIEVERL